MGQEYTVILASGSPRRKEILTLAGVVFTVMKSDASEDCTETDPARLVCQLSCRKARAVAEELGTAVGTSVTAPAARCSQTTIGSEQAQITPVVVLGADTVVAYQGRIFGKPHDCAEAEEMLLTLQGQTHSVFTGVSLLVEREQETSAAYDEAVLSYGARRFAEHCFFVETRVTFAAVSRETIAAYAATGEPLDKAGSYAIQGGFAPYITELHGDYYNVVGLPIARIFRECEALGITLRREWAKRL